MNSSMQRVITLSLLLTITILVFSSCEPTSPTNYEPISVTGQVTDSQQTPIDNAIVRIISPLPEVITTTNEVGYYTFDLQVDSTINYVVEFRKEGYTPRTIDFLAIPERNVSLPVIRLTSTESESGGGVTPPDNENSEGSAFITLRSITTNSIQVRETGGVESAVFEFLVTDSLGTPVSDSKAATVNFEIASGPSGGESISPASATTVNGVVRGTLNSGTKAGAVQVRASFSRDGIVMRSSPVSVTISGGLPNDTHFEVSASQVNMPAASSGAVEIISLLGDRYGNTVPAGTAVYFTTNKGAINGSAATDTEGYARSQLRTNNTSPGMAKVRVETVSESSERISREVDILFSGRTQLSVSPTNIELEGLTEQEFTVTLADENGRPLASGTTLSVNLATHPQLTLAGVTQATLTDETEAGEGVTNFKFRLVNASRQAVTENALITVSSIGPNGNASRELRFNATPAPADPASISLLSVSTTDLGVQGTGQEESTNLIFVVRDTNGNPVDGVDVNFRLGQSPQGGERITTPTVTTNANGQAVATLVSGTKSGVVQVLAEIMVQNGQVIRTTQPVQLVINAGLPSQQHFTVITELYNIPRILGDEIQFNALVGDKYGNMVPDGTAVYFTSDTGFIQGSGLTVNGRAAVYLTLGNPLQSNGFATITATTANDERQQITASARIIISGPPIITVTPESFDIENAEDQKFDFTVKDENGHPMANGTTITVTAEGDELTLIGDTNVSIERLFSDFSNLRQWTDFSFTIDDANPDITNDTPVQITIEVRGPSGSARKTLTGRKAKSIP